MSPNRVWSICGQCEQRVPVQIELGESALLVRTCPTHGMERLLLEADLDYFGMQVATRAAAGLVDTRQVSFRGQRFDIRRNPQALVLELTDDCDMTCSTCIAGSHEGAGNYKTTADIKRLFQFAAANRQVPQTLFVSGGEPTLHPDLEQIVAAGYDTGFEHVILISNGKRLADDQDFAPGLKRQFPTLEVYLQFDSFDAEILRDIRGSDFSALRRRALDALTENDISTTLVAVVKAGESLETVGRTLQVALSRSNIIGVTLQPLRASGRHASHPNSSTAPTIGELVQALTEQSDFVQPRSVIPHPLAPENIAVGYFRRSTLASETCDVLTQTRSESGPRLLVPPDGTTERELLRLLIVCYIDKFNIRSEMISELPIHIILPSGTLPLDVYYLYADLPDGVPVSLRATA